MDKAASIEDLTEPRDIVLQAFAGGVKIKASVIDDLFGGKNDKIRINASIEGEKRSRIGLLSKEKGEGIDELADRLWRANDNRLDYDSKYTTQDYKEAIEQVLQDHNSAGSMARELVDKYIDNVKQDLTDTELKEISDDLAKKVNKEMDSLDEDVQTELFALLEKYQDKNGSIDWDKLNEDTQGFTPEILELSDKTQTQLYELINRKREGQNEPFDANPENESSENNKANDTPKPQQNPQ